MTRPVKRLKRRILFFFLVVFYSVSSFPQTGSPIFSTSVLDTQSCQKPASELKPEKRAVTPAWTGKVATSSNKADPYLYQQTYLNIIDYFNAASLSKKPVIVAVLDSGIDYNHEDLQGALWRNPKNSGQMGFDFINRGSLPFDDFRHGTHVAGIIAARAQNGIGIKGIAQNARIMALKILDHRGVGRVSDAIAAIDFATQNGAQIINHSWGLGWALEEWENKSLRSALNRASQKGIIHVAAAGNCGFNLDSKPLMPVAGISEKSFSVAATKSLGLELSTFSNFGLKSVDLAAPGERIFSTVPGGYRALTGSSFAAPQVSALIALILGSKAQMPAAKIKQTVMDHVSAKPGLRTNVQSGGILQIERTFKAL